MENKEHFFYVLECSDGSYYAGYTNNLVKRIKLHNEGKGAKYTKGRGPVRLLYSKHFNNKSEALKAEYQFKQWTRKKKEMFLVQEMGELYVAAEKL
ncbi:GIY-YIG nuclease family protein [Bacillus sp. CGMCC 1.16607]|uniref:GIY-YIG nuclease family protein n=1 Tax=Bacillus sp. CGMCC 1.16607 TaxID=3351842 RepID=UPI0036409655